MSNKWNEPAYPTEELDRLSQYHDPEFALRGGLTKREYFVAMAMQGLLSYKASYFPEEHGNGESLAKAAVRYADEVLKALEEKK